MCQIENTVNIFEELRKHYYKITIEDGTSFILKFFPEHYHHLAGFQHLTDLPHISNPLRKDKFYRDVKKGDIAEDSIVASAKYSEIAERIQSFGNLREILCSGDCKVIINFNAQLSNSKIDAKFYLYK